MSDAVDVKNVFVRIENVSVLEFILLKFWGTLKKKCSIIEFSSNVWWRQRLDLCIDSDGEKKW